MQKSPRIAEISTKVVRGILFYVHPVDADAHLLDSNHTETNVMQTNAHSCMAYLMVGHRTMPLPSKKFLDLAGGT